MIKRIRDTSKTEPYIRDTSKTEPLIDPDVVAAALGAELPGIPIEGGSVPMALLGRAREAGKRPAPPRGTLTLSVDQAKQLTDLAASLATDAFTPTTGQVAAALLRLALKTLADPAADRAPLAAALAEVVASERQPDNGSASETGTAPKPAS